MARKILRRLNSEKRVTVGSTDDIPSTHLTRGPLGPRKLYGPRRGFRYPRGVETVDLRPKIKAPSLPAVRDRDCLCLPPWNFQPFNARPFDLAQTSDPFTGVVGQTEIICSVVVPEGYYARISAFGQNIDDATAWTDFYWRIRVDGNCIYPYAPQITMQLGRIYDPTEVFWIAEEGATIDIWIQTCICTGAYPMNAYARIKGWFWPNTK